MRRLVIISARGDGRFVGQLREAASARGAEVMVCGWSSLSGLIGQGPQVVIATPLGSGEPIELSPADAVLVRSMPPGTLEQIVVRMDLLWVLQSQGLRIVNPPKAIEAAVDKYLSLSRLAGAGLSTPATAVCQRSREAMAAFESLGGDVVVKSLFGAEGLGMTRITDPALAQRAFAQLERMASAIYLQRYINHGGSDWRVLVVGGRVLASMRRRCEDWRTNLGRGGRPEACAIDDELADMAVRAAAACGAVVAGVDIAADAEGQRYVLEVNAVPGWAGLESVCDVDVPGAIVAAALDGGGA